MYHNTYLELDKGAKFSKNFGDPCDTKNISQIGSSGSRGSSNLSVDSGIQAQSDLPLGHVVRHIPLVGRVR